MKRREVSALFRAVAVFAEAGSYPATDLSVDIRREMSRNLLRLFGKSALSPNVRISVDEGIFMYYLAAEVLG